MHRLRPERPRTLRYQRCKSHDERRVAGHPLDLERFERARAAIGQASWCQSQAFAGIFGDANAFPIPHPMARVLAFPGCFGGELAAVRAELEELRRVVRGGW
jgi:hypothetical protein